MKPEERYIKINVSENKDGSQQLSLDIKGLTGIEIIGLLAYYKDEIQIKMMSDARGGEKPDLTPEI